MSRMVFCNKLQKELPGLSFQTWPGELGKRIFENISAEAWGQWVNHQTMLINEYRLNPMEQKSKDLIISEMEKFLFGGGSEPPADFVPEGDPNDPLSQEY